MYVLHLLSVDAAARVELGRPRKRLQRGVHVLARRGGGGRRGPVGGRREPDGARRGGGALVRVLLVVRAALRCAALRCAALRCAPATAARVCAALLHLPVHVVAYVRCLLGVHS